MFEKRGLDGPFFVAQNSASALQQNWEARRGRKVPLGATPTPERDACRSRYTLI